jgi:serpin B
MGLPDAFISALRHTTRINVDERGTKAAAGTAAVMGRSLPRTIVVDRPFLVAIVDRRSGAFLFLGRINDPGQT